MEKFKVTIEIEAESQQQAGEKLEAFDKLDAGLQHDELIGMADYVENDPEGVARIIGWIKEPPVWLKPFINKAKQ